MKFVLSLPIFAALFQAVASEKDDSYYIAGTGNPNTKYKMYWKDAENVLQDIDKFSSLHVQFHSCQWTWEEVEDSGNDVDENDYWYLGKIPNSGANVAFSLYGSLKGHSFRGCEKSTFINSFYTNQGFTDFAAAMYHAGVDGFAAAYKSEGNYMTSSCLGGYGVGCDSSNGFAVHSYKSDLCDPSEVMGVKSRLKDINAAMGNANCVEIYSSKSGSSSVSTSSSSSSSSSNSGSSSSGGNGNSNGSGGYGTSTSSYSYRGGFSYTNSYSSYARSSSNSNYNSNSNYGSSASSSVSLSSLSGGSAIDLLSYSHACLYQDVFSPDGKCPDPYGRLALYEENFYDGIQESKSHDPYHIYARDVAADARLFHGHILALIGLGLWTIAGFLYCHWSKKYAKKVGRKRKAGKKKKKKTLDEDDTDGDTVATNVEHPTSPTPISPRESPPMHNTYVSAENILTEDQQRILGHPPLDVIQPPASQQLNYPLPKTPPQPLAAQDLEAANGPFIIVDHTAPLMYSPSDDSSLLTSSVLPPTMRSTRVDDTGAYPYQPPAAAFQQNRLEVPPVKEEVVPISNSGSSEPTTVEAGNVESGSNQPSLGSLDSYLAANNVSRSAVPPQQEVADPTDVSTKVSTVQLHEAAPVTEPEEDEEENEVSAPEEPAETTEEPSSEAVVPEETVEEEAAQETVDEEAVQETVDEEAVQETVEEDAVQETVEEDAVQETVEEEAVQETVEEDAVQETVEEETPQETVEEETPQETVEEEIPQETVEEETPQETVDEEASQEETASRPDLEATGETEEIV